MDIDNSQKVALDAMQGHVYGNDAQIRRIVMDYGYPTQGGALSVIATQWREAE
jgi:Holliday junction resolvase RusA-like endonuclease